MYVGGILGIDPAQGLLVQPQQPLQGDPVPTHQFGRQVQEQGEVTIVQHARALKRAPAESLAYSTLLMCERLVIRSFFSSRRLGVAYLYE